MAKQGMNWLEKISVGTGILALMWTLNGLADGDSNLLKRNEVLQGLYGVTAVGAASALYRRGRR